ncbi:DUF4388 domain-containing protein [Pelotalea chapellei]|uniref:DUF4388 domain-containing protein n=1 Tax=Pelotalea chapellei TaxID=44671 RepID=A0ABS5U7D9_9BACT|nr:DUF4388 domain-containing protein [Pelotalea chapellei]MBT1071569.1 DUF4388 domain-containing protein [Pelotalea chapellei]
MSFSGDLEHLPIVDVIQLLHSTRKTGTLCLKSHKGESQLVFNDGYIVSANHVNNSVRIGRILLDTNAISQADLDLALEQQKSAGSNRKPLIATLIEGGKLNREDAYTGLETLIGMSIVEVLTWTKGTFSLDVHTTVISDEYRYFPETLKEEINMNTQSILMDALRIYDEKMRDGTLESGTFLADSGQTLPEQDDTNQAGRQITVDDLGLDELDHLEKSIPDVFGGLKEYDPSEIHRQKIRETVPGLNQTQHETLLAALMAFSDTSLDGKKKPSAEHSPLAVIVFSRDDFLKHEITTVCKYENMFVFTTDEENSIDLIIDQSFSRGLIPLLIIDSPEAGELQNALRLLHQKQKYLQLLILQLATPDDNEFALQALQAGAHKVICRPADQENKDQFIDESTTFLRTLHETITNPFYTHEQMVMNKFKKSILELETLREVPDIAAIPLKFASTMFERCIMFVVSSTELIAEKSIGVKSNKRAGLSSPLMFKISLTQPSPFQKVIQSGVFHYGQCADSPSTNHLFKEIGLPRESKILLMPIKSFGRVIAIIYGDFGSGTTSPVQTDLLDIMTRFAGLVLDNNLYRKKIEKHA